MIDTVSASGMSAMAAPVLWRKKATVVISIVGPRSCPTPARRHELAPALVVAAAELGPIGSTSSLLGRPHLGKG